MTSTELYRFLLISTEPGNIGNKLCLFYTLVSGLLLIVDKEYSLEYSSITGGIMQNANANKFKSELKEYMDAAVSDPVRINRRDGQGFILMSEQLYDGFRNEVLSLQRRLLGMSEIVDGRTKPPPRAR